MEKLEKGYKKEELNEFFKTAFKNRKTPRRTADGGWETVDAQSFQDVSSSVGSESPEGVVTDTGSASGYEFSTTTPDVFVFETTTVDKHPTNGALKRLAAFVNKVIGKR
jgi:hypothetical protein